MARPLSVWTREGRMLLLWDLTRVGGRVRSGQGGQAREVWLWPCGARHGFGCGACHR